MGPSELPSPAMAETGPPVKRPAVTVVMPCGGERREASEAAATLRSLERGPDDELRLQFEAVTRLDPEEKKVIRSVIESIILRHEARRWSSGAETK